MILGTDKVSLILNSSNQANLLHTKESNLLQTNLIVLFGKSFISNNSLPDSKIPLIVKINKNGDVNVSSSRDINIENDIRIHSDKKISMSEKGGN